MDESGVTTFPWLGVEAPPVLEIESQQQLHAFSGLRCLCRLGSAVHAVHAVHAFPRKGIPVIKDPKPHRARRQLRAAPHTEQVPSQLPHVHGNHILVKRKVGVHGLDVWREQLMASNLLEPVDRGRITERDGRYRQEQSGCPQGQPAARQADGLDVCRIPGQVLVEVEAVELKGGGRRAPFQLAKNLVQELVGEVQ